MMPVVGSLERTARQVLLYSLATVAASFVFGVVADMHWFYWTVAAVSGAVFVGFCARLLIVQSAAAAMKVFHWSISYLSLDFRGHGGGRAALSLAP